ncbi:hypothetical protein [Pyrobaculum ferrireducens]|uniref:Uncharacterized protein n=1 Tax=Pyrobaculum ferrireducens TaxID=1104324 RepID=G7VBE4_9CREN|nr:hypothetical protein [Pyrobaculum ferrireducens]AET32374.1 hypothetical protein P186_0933 [Pyrobaculum ferrireducens]
MGVRSAFVILDEVTYPQEVVQGSAGAEAGNRGENRQSWRRGIVGQVKYIGIPPTPPSTYTE